MRAAELRDVGRSPRSSRRKSPREDSERNATATGGGTREAEAQLLRAAPRPGVGYRASEYRYLPQPRSDEAPLRASIVRLTSRYGRYGDPMINGLLSHEG